jgi:hypothetical protein
VLVNDIKAATAELEAGLTSLHASTPLPPPPSQEPAAPSAAEPARVFLRVDDVTPHSPAALAVRFYARVLVVFFNT